MAVRPHPETGAPITCCNRCGRQLHFAPTFRKASEEIVVGDVIVATRYTAGDHSADIVTEIIRIDQLENTALADNFTVGLRVESGGVYYGWPGKSYDLADPSCDTHLAPAGAAR